MEGDLSSRREKRSKSNIDSTDREIRGIVLRELTGGSGQQGHGSEQQARGRGESSMFGVGN
jgi:hypothetical protein